MQIARANTCLSKKVVQIFSHSFGQSHDKRFVAFCSMDADFCKEIIDLSSYRTHLYRRIEQTGRTNQLFNHHPA